MFHGYIALITHFCVATSNNLAIQHEFGHKKRAQDGAAMCRQIRRSERVAEGSDVGGTSSEASPGLDPLFAASSLCNKFLLRYRLQDRKRLEIHINPPEPLTYEIGHEILHTRLWGYITAERFTTPGVFLSHPD